MEPWILYGIISAIFVSIADIIRKHLANSTKNVTFIVLLPLSIAGILAFLYLMIHDHKQEFKALTQTDYSYIIVLALCIILVQYCITSCLKHVDNPGYGKAIISLNTLITTLVAIYIFKTAKINKYTLGGILLIIIGTGLLIINYTK